MNLKRCYLTKNDCYINAIKHTVNGIMVHSTAANNPYLKRYVAPDDGLLGKNQYNNHWNICHPGGKDITPHKFVSDENGYCKSCSEKNSKGEYVYAGRQVCVHAFIGKLNDGTIATYQTLPWDMVGWHSGNGSLGSAKNANNTGYIGFEICEDRLTDRAYFDAVYRESVELCSHLCQLYKLNPLADGVLICHSEGYKRGIASNHGDVMHWFVRPDRVDVNCSVRYCTARQRRSQPA